jgi:hypothetical protein
MNEIYVALKPLMLMEHLQKATQRSYYKENHMPFTVFNFFETLSL